MYFHLYYGLNVKCMLSMSLAEANHKTCVLQTTTHRALLELMMENLRAGHTQIYGQQWCSETKSTSETKYRK